MTIICTSPQKPQGVDLVCPLSYSILHFSFFKKERKRRMPRKKHYYYVGGSTNCHNKLTCSKHWAYTKLWEWIPRPHTLSISQIEHWAICVMCVIVVSQKHRFWTRDIFVVENYLCEFHIGQIYIRRWAKHDLLSWWGTSPTTTKQFFGYLGVFYSTLLLLVFLFFSKFQSYLSTTTWLLARYSPLLNGSNFMAHQTFEVRQYMWIHFPRPSFFAPACVCSLFQPFVEHH